MQPDDIYSHLISYINNQLITPLSKTDILALKSAFVPKRYRKHQYLLQEGEVCKLAGFLVKGAMKQYIVDASGKENILGLYIENWWVGDRESFNSGAPSAYFIDAFEESQLLVITRDDFDNQLRHLPFITDLLRVLSEKQALQLLKRVHVTKALTAEQRLADLEKTYPDFLQRFPQHLIASYLGMTKETLSRIRGSALRK